MHLCLFANLFECLYALRFNDTLARRIYRNDEKARESETERHIQWHPKYGSNNGEIGDSFSNVHTIAINWRRYTDALRMYATLLWLKYASCATTNLISNLIHLNKL